jgi:excinuclease ABC subunit C
VVSGSASSGLDFSGGNPSGGAAGNKVFALEGTDVAGLFFPQAFVDFGPTLLDPSRPRTALMQIAAPRPAELRRQVREQGPKRPGVYGMVDGQGELIYVGKAKSLRARLLSYFRTRSRDPKAGRILERTARLVWECCPSEFAALHRELELIRRWRPRFNVQGQPRGRRRTYVCLGRPPAPYAFLARRTPARVQASFGPVPAGRHAHEAVRRLNDWFQLRDCSQEQTMLFADQAELFPVLRGAGCLRHEIGTCLGPCAGACTRSAYADKVAAARAFLAGTDRTPLEVLEREMAAASAALAFERAAGLRDKLTALRWLGDQLDRLQLARRRYSFVYPVSGQEGHDLWYLIHSGRTVAVTLPPRDGDSARAAAATVEAVFGNTTPPAGTVAPDDMDSLLLITSWFRRYPEERRRVLKPSAALAGCRGVTR